MIGTIHQPQYLPWLGYFDKVDQADVFILLDDVQFKKNDWQNRNKIRTPQGSQWMTAPILHHFGQKINEVQIDNKTNWRQAHLKALQLNYCKAPFFDQYIGLFKEVYQKEWKLLCDLNIFLIKEFIDLLGIQTRIVLSSEFNVSDESTKRLMDLCQKVEADTYLAGADGSKYMDVDQFQQSGIKLTFQDFYHPTYYQLWTKGQTDNFMMNLSIVDLLFNYGEKSLNILRGENS